MLEEAKTVRWIIPRFLRSEAARFASKPQSGDLRLWKSYCIIHSLILRDPAQTSGSLLMWSADKAKTKPHEGVETET